jgi:hypothetical protein
VLGLGFGVLFPISAAWCLGYEYAPKLIDWWKMWELNSGFFLGPLYVVVLYWAMRQVDEEPATNSGENSSRFRPWCETIAMVCGLFLMIFIASREEFLVVGILLGLFYVLSILLTMRTRNAWEDRRWAVSFVYSAFLLVFIMAWGMSTQAGILLELYDKSAADQYAWPIGRVILFMPVGIVITGAAVLKMWHVIGNPRMGLPPICAVPLVSVRLVDLMAFMGVVGAVSIWPAKIGVFYAIFLGIGLYSFNRLNLGFALVDMQSKGNAQEV